MASTSIDKLLATALAEVGYLEKASNSNLDDKVVNAGSANYTKYARDVYPALQGQSWCDMYVDWCFVETFGRENALRLLGGFSAYTPTSAQYYKDKKNFYLATERGDQIFFKNSIRICHTGLVTKVDSKKVYTVEGNTSSGSGVVPNGGGVFEKSYDLNDPKIAGYGRPDWSLVENEKYTIGWTHDSYGWWYADTENTYYKSCWKIINGHKYYFNEHGYAVIGWQKIDNKWYYFEPTLGHPLECALYVSDDNGVQVQGEF